MIQKVKIKEIKPIPGFNNLYYADKKGNIYSENGKYDKSLKVLKKGKNLYGYEIVTLCFNKKRFTKTVHRLIMITFNGESDLVVNHKNGNKSDNDINNLEYVTRKENSRHAIDNKLFIPNTIGIAESKRKKVIRICLVSNEITEYISAHDAAKKTGFNRGNISTGCRNGIIFYKSKWCYII
jgi:hypothetical protein